MLDDTLATLDHLHKEAIEKARLTEGRLKWYSELKSNLKGNGIEVDDISKFAKVVRVIYEQGYDASKVVQTYTDIDTLKGHKF